jgi:hypothetical protein
LAQLVAAELARLSAEPIAHDEVQYSSPHPGLDPHAIAWYLQNTRVEGAWLM